MVATLAPALYSDFSIDLLASIHSGSGAAEIIAYEKNGSYLFSTLEDHKSRSYGYIQWDISDPKNPREVIRTSWKALLDSDKWILNSVPSISVDPLGRGIGAAIAFPRFSHRHTGKLILFSTQQYGTVHEIMDVGYHPDCVTWSPDGRYILVANEGEFKWGARQQAPGSLTIVEIESTQSHPGYRVVSVETYDFSPDNLHPTVDISAIRIPAPEGKHPRHHLFEPEYISVLENRVIVSLQENNALAVFNLDSRKWTRLIDLGSWPYRADASDRDGPFGGRAIRIDDPLWGMPMPDTIHAFRLHGRNLVVTANEGDARSDGWDRVRAKHLGARGPALNPAVRAELKNHYGSDPLLDANLGRIQVSILDGDIDGDGRIEQLTTFGTRGFMIFDIDSGERVFSSGDFLESFIASVDPRSFNMNRGDLRHWDTRSDNKGPEPEAVTLGQFGDRLLLFVSSERQNGIFVFEILSPQKVHILGYIPSIHRGHYSPESMIFISGESRPDGRNLLVSGFEGSRTITIFELNEPATNSTHEHAH